MIFESENGKAKEAEDRIYAMTTELREYREVTPFFLLLEQDTGRAGVLPWWPFFHGLLTLLEKLAGLFS